MRRCCCRPCSRIFPTRLAWQSHDFNDISTGNDATPLWIPQIAMAVGTIVLLIAFIDEFVLEWRGLRTPTEKEAAEEAPHIE